MIEPANGYTSDGVDFHPTIEEAQKAALASLLGDFQADADGKAGNRAVAAFLVSKAVEVTEILMTKHRGRPRKKTGATKMRKASLRTAPLPLDKAKMEVPA